MRKFFSFVAATLFAVTMIAAPYTLKFGYYDSTSSDKTNAETALSNLFDEASMAYLSEEGAVLTNVYLGRKYKDKVSGDSVFSNIKFGSSTKAGVLTFALKDMNVDSVVFRAALYGDSEGNNGFKVNGQQFTLSAGNKVFEDITYVPAEAITALSIEQVTANKGRFYMTSITVYPKENGSGEDPNPQPSDEVWSIAGSSAALFGAAWDPASAPEMTKQNDGTYLWQSAEVALGKGDVQFKVVKGHAWGEEYPKNDDGSNYKLDIPEDASYIVTITFNPETKEIGATAEKVGSVEIQHTAAIRGLNQDWSKGLELILAQDGKSAEASIQLASGDQEFKVVVDGSQWRSNAGTFTRENTSVENLTGNDNDNMKLQADVAGEYSFKWIFDGDVLIITFPEKSGDDPVDPITPAGDKFVKVTAAPSDWAGSYLIVYEDESVAFNGGLETLDAANNTIPVEFTEGEILASDDNIAAIFTIAAVEGGYSVQAANGKYIGVTSYGNGLKQGETPYVHSILKLDENGNAVIALSNEAWGGDMILNYNANKSDKRFRYYKSGSQKPIQLYRLVESGDTPVDPQPEVAHYLIGNAAEMGAWTIENALPMDGDSIDLELAEGGYAFKIVPSKAWDQPGQLQCSAIGEGQEKLSCDADNNICFTMPSAAKVTIKVLENKVYVLGIPDGEIVVPDTHYLIGDSAALGAWNIENALFMDGDSLELTLPAGIYMFKIVATKAWNQPGQLDCTHLAEGQDNVGCEGSGNDQKNVKFYLAEAATVTIKVIDGQIYVLGIPETVDPQPGKTGYALLVNGETYIDLQHGEEYDGYDQWFTDKAELKANDVVLIYSYEAEAAWAIGILNPASSKYVERSDNGLFFSKEGTYTIYLKLKYEADEIYVAPLPDEGGDVPPVTPEGPIVLKFNGTGVADKDDSNEYGKDVAKIFDEASAPYVASVDSVKKVYAARPIDGDNSSLKFGTSSVAGYLAFTLATEMEFDSIIVNATQYGKNPAQIKINQQYEFTLNAGNKVPQDCKVIPTLEFESKQVFIEMLGTERLYLRSITLYPKQGDTPVDPQPSEVTYSLKNNWDGGADWYWKEMEQKAPHLWQLNNVVFGGTGVNLISNEEGFEERWYAADGEYKFTEFSDAIQAGDTVSFDWDPEADTLCAKIVGKYIPGETPQTRYFLKNNWDGGEWRWKEMSAVPTVENYWQLQDVFGGTGVNLNTQASDEGQQWFPLDKIVGGDQIQAEDTVLFVYNATDGTLAARLIGRPGGDTPGPQVPDLYIKNNWDAAQEWTWKKMTYEVVEGTGSYYVKDVVFGGTGVNLNSVESDEGAQWFAAEDIQTYTPAGEKTTLQVRDTVTFIYVAALKTLVAYVTGPVGAVVPPQPTDMIDLYLVPGVWNQDGAKYACLTLSELPEGITDVKDLTIERLMMAATVSDWFEGGDTTVAKIPADTKVVAFGRFNPVVETPSIQAIMTEGMLWNHSDILALDPSLIYTITGWPAEGKDFCPGYWGEKPAVVTVSDGFYLVGSFNDWTLSENYKLNANEGADGEYWIELNLTEGDEFQIWVISNGQKTFWYPVGDGQNLVVDAAHAGKVKIYFRPTGNPDWEYYFFYIEVDQTQGLNNINATGKAVKMIQNGQIIIIKGDKTYNVLGTLVK